MRTCVLFLTVLTLLTGPVGAKHDSVNNPFNLVPGRDYVPGQIVVKLVPELRQQNANAADVLSECKAGLLQELPAIGWQVLAIPEEEPFNVLKMVERLRDDPRVEYVTPNYIRHLAAWTPNDYFYTEGHLWNFDIIGMPDAWDMDTSAPLNGGDPEIVVAVIDSGVAYKDYVDTISFPGTSVIHAKAPDLSLTNFWINEDEIPDNGVDDDGNGYIDDREGYNWPYASPYPCDDNEHGTHVTGTIAQSTNNNPSGIEDEFSAAGMAFNTTIMPLKSGGQNGSSAMSDVAAAILYAADNGAHIINMSLGSGGVGEYSGDNAEGEACEYAYDAGVLIFSSTGNDADSSGWSSEFNGVGYPAAYPSVVAVGATNNMTTPGDPSTEIQSEFSQYGYTAELLAPSGSYYSGDYDNSGRVDLTFQQTIKSKNWPDLSQFKIKGFAGTSMASPHAAAHAALLMAYGKQMGWSLNHDDYRNMMAASAVDLNAAARPGYDYIYGFGRIDVPASFTVDPDPYLVVREASVFEADGQGNGNYRPEAGEMVSMKVDLMTMFGGATGIEATITSSDPMVTVHTSTINYPDIGRHDRAEPLNTVLLTINPSCPLHYEAAFQAQVGCNEEANRSYTFHALLTPARVMFWKDDRFGGNSKWQDEPIRQALDAAGIDYDLYITTPKITADVGEQFRYPWEPLEFTKLPTFEDLRKYDAVIWYVGQNGLSKKELAGQTLPQVVQYLEGGGNMFITGHELVYNMAQPPATGDRVVWLDPDATPNPDDVNEYNAWFIYNYLGVAAIDHDNWYETVKGSVGDPLTRGLNQTMDLMVYNKKLDYNWWPDNLVPRDTAIPCVYSGPPVRPGDDYTDAQTSFDSDQPTKTAERSCAVRWDNGFRLVFCAFPVEAMENPGELVIPMVNWLLTGQETASEILVKIDTDYRRTAYNSDMDPPYGDPFDLHGYIFNPGSDVQAQRWMLMQIFDMFWVWPTWQNLTEGYAFENVTIPQGHSYQEFLVFEWPHVDSEFDNIFFWFAHLTPTGQLLGTFDFCEAGYYMVP
ncbi:S8 family serine peptidase [bacterium]|nr:S8 family serine peptidase [candidate division CSSED10-310 bacterium]